MLQVLQYGGGEKKYANRNFLEISSSLSLRDNKNFSWSVKVAMLQYAANDFAFIQHFNRF